MELKELKKKYDGLSKKYNLPSFKELDENFEIGKLEKENNIILKVVRKAMMEKIVNSLGFVEMLLNPMNLPKMYHNYIKGMSVEDKKTIEKIYLAFSELSISSLEREIEYDEKMEAELIKEILKVWNAEKKGFVGIIQNIRNPGKVGKKDRSYFG